MKERIFWERYGIKCSGSSPTFENFVAVPLLYWFLGGIFFVECYNATAY